MTEWLINSNTGRNTKDRYLSLDEQPGFASVDATGVPVKFLSKDEMRSTHVHDMLGADITSQVNRRLGTFAVGIPLS